MASEIAAAKILSDPASQKVSGASPAQPLSIRSRSVGLILILLTLASIGWIIAGGPVVPLWVLAFAAITMAWSHYLGWSAALALAIGGLLIGEYGVLRVSGALGLALPLLDVAVWGILALGAGVGVALRPPTRPDVRTTAVAASAASGGALVIISVALAQLLPGALRIAWGMNGDFVNSIVFARSMLGDGGIDPSSTPQPTPLPFAMMAANFASGRGSIADDALLEHDVTRSLAVWMGAIALSSLLAGVIVARAVRGLRPALAIPLVALASCAMLTWYVIGVQLQFGFVNSAFAILALLAAWVAYSAGAQRPVAGLASLFALATVVLAVWSPLVVCIAALGLALIVRGRQALLRLRPAGAIGLGATIALFLLYGAAVTVPTFLEDSGHLGANGGFPPIGPASITVIAAICVLSAILAGRYSSVRHDAVGVMSFVGGLSLGILYLLIQRLGAEDQWGYYVAKFAWTGSVVMIVLSAAVAAALIHLHPPRRSWDFAAVVGACGVIAALLWAPSAAPRPDAQLPLIGILAGNAFGLDNRLSEVVFELSGRDNGQDFLWRSATVDFWPNFWLLQVDLPAPDQDPVRTFAHYTTGLGVIEVCEIIELMVDDVTIHTADPAAGAEIAATCPREDYRVVLDGY